MNFRAEAPVTLLSVLLTALTYIIIGRASLYLATPPMLATPVWPAAGFAFCVLATGGIRLWPGVFLGSFLVNIWAGHLFGNEWSGRVLAFSIISASGTCTQAVITVLMTSRAIRSEGIRPIIGYLVLAAPLGCIISASVSVTAQVLLNVVREAPIWLVWTTWWLGDSMGVLVLAPLAPVLCSGRARARSRRLAFLGLPMLAALAVIIFFFLTVRGWEEQRIERRFRDETNRTTTALRKGLDHISGIFHQMEGYLVSSDAVSRTEFHRFFRRETEKIEGLSFLGWAPRITKQARHGEDSFVVQYLEPRSREGSFRDMDVAENLVARKNLDGISRNGGLHAICSFPDGISDNRNAALLLIMPVYEGHKKNVRPRPDLLKGYLFGALNMQTLTRIQIPASSPAFVLQKENNQILVKRGFFSQRHRIFSDDVNFGNRRFTLRFQLTDQHRKMAASWGPWMVLITGHLLVGFLGAFLLWYLIHTAGVEKLVAKRTIQLERSKRALEQEVRDRNRAETALIEARDDAETAARAKSTFLANMTHEIKTPMNGIIGMNRLLLETRLDDRQRDYAATVQASADAMLDLINDILDFSKMEAGRMVLETEDFHLASVMRDVIEIMEVTAAEKELELVSYIHSEIPEYLRGDSGKLRRMLLCLIGHSIKSTHKGSIMVSVQLVGLEIDCVSLRLEVRDTGPIPATHRSFSESADSGRLSPFGGSELGLAICEKLVNFMNGSMGREVGDGSLIWVHLPMQPATAMYCSGSMQRTEPITGLRVILCHGVEPESLYAQLLTRGWRVERHEGEETVREALIRNRLAGTPFDLVIICDDKTAGDLRKLADRGGVGEGTPVMVLSHRGNREDARTAAALGFSAYLTLPLDTDLLDQRLEEICQGKGLVVSENQPVTEPSTTDHSRALILVVEDNAVNQKMIRAMLDEPEFEIICADNGIEALEELGRNKVDLILMDCQMPQMNGFEAAGAIRMMDLPPVPIIAMTANTMRYDREKCLAVGMDDYMGKPITRELLLNKVRLWLQASVATPSTTDKQSS